MSGGTVLLSSETTAPPIPLITFLIHVLTFDVSESGMPLVGFED